ncbi:response regulator [Falsibacillus pallidus]|uniref:Two-component system response regulator YesN n=1 Tax=Falsibacillus pallidus TaxID=493781 RepID=A0A370G9M9_9BACI|nr:response regulator [Falsibacillus pallidus]RDI39164.1 two-component system response regulator YesN [Falsibacillus pallidus]
MVKLLIVDDEQTEREGLRVILKRAFPELNIDEAKNGKIAVQKADEFQPDLIMMDIKMPGMNGLEAIELISAAHPAIKFIMITAYDTFEFARQALKLGVKDYLLKPSTIKEIGETVGKVLKEIEEEQESIAKSRKQQDALQKALTLVETDVVTQLLFDHVHEVHLDMLVEMLHIHPASEKFVMMVLLPAGSEQHYSAIKEKIRTTKSGWVGALYGRQLPIIVFRDSEKSFRSQAIFLAGEIIKLAKKDQAAGWFVGIGNPCSSLEAIRQSYQEALIASMDASLPVKYRFYSELPPLGTAEDEQMAKKREQQFLDQVRLGEWEKVRENLFDLIQRFVHEGASMLQIQQKVLELLWIAGRVMSEMGMEIETPMFSFQAQDPRQLQSETSILLEQMRQSYEEHHERLEADSIHQLRQFIMEHSHEDISLDALGRKVGLSPIYISKLFKERLGINYIDFLTECRITKAKKLMQDPEKSIKEITFEVGYHEPNYFSKVFKKVCGVSPKDYRKTLTGQKAGI